jgi:hypothetical protein
MQNVSTCVDRQRELGTRGQFHDLQAQQGQLRHTVKDYKFQSTAHAKCLYLCRQTA